MKAEQRIVAIGVASGIVVMALGVWLLAEILPAPAVADMIGERLAYALRANVFAIVPLFVMLATVGNSRFLAMRVGALGITNTATYGAEVGIVGLAVNMAYAAAFWLWLRRSVHAD